MHFDKEFFCIDTFVKYIFMILKNSLTYSVLASMQRSKLSLRVHLTIEAQYATKPAYAQSVTTSLQVQHEMPSTGVLRGLEVRIATLTLVFVTWYFCQIPSSKFTVVSP